MMPVTVSVTRVSVTVTCIVVSIILYLVISTCTGSSTNSVSTNQGLVVTHTLLLVLELDRFSIEPKLQIQSL